MTTEPPDPMIPRGYWPYLGPAMVDLHNALEALQAKVDRWPTQAPPTLPFEDRLGVTHSAAGQTSTYHVWANGLRAGAGLLIWLHGDGAWEHTNHTNPYVFGGPAGVVAQARARGYITVSALTPATDKTWWNLGLSRANYLLVLLDHLRRGYAVNPGRVILAGYSGGAQQIMQYWMNRYAEALAGGGGLIAFGGRHQTGHDHAILPSPERAGADAVDRGGDRHRRERW